MVTFLLMPSCCCCWAPDDKFCCSSPAGGVLHHFHHNWNCHPAIINPGKEETTSSSLSLALVDPTRNPSGRRRIRIGSSRTRRKKKKSETWRRKRSCTEVSSLPWRPLPPSCCSSRQEEAQTRLSTGRSRSPLPRRSSRRLERSSPSTLRRDTMWRCFRARKRSLLATSKRQERRSLAPPGP